MKYTALKTYASYQAGKVYNFADDDVRAAALLKAGIVEPYVKAKRSVKVSRPTETK